MITSRVLFLMLMLPVKFVKVGLLYSLSAAAKDSHSATELVKSLIISLRSSANTPQLRRKSHHNHAANNTKGFPFGFGRYLGISFRWRISSKNTITKLCSGMLSCNMHEQTCAYEHLHAQYCNLHAWLRVHISRHCDGASGAAEAKAVRRH